MSDMNQPYAGGRSPDFGTENARQSGLPVDHHTAGMILRHVREVAGLHIGALAVLLKVPVKKLEALEADRYDLLPDIVFARALALSVCRTLKVDPAPILDRFPESVKPLLASRSASINAPFRARGVPRSSGWAYASRRAIIAGVVLLAGAVVLVMFPVLKSGVEAIKVMATSYSSADQKDVPRDTAVASIDPVDAAGKPSTSDAGASSGATDVAAGANTQAGLIGLQVSSTLSSGGQSPASGSLVNPLVNQRPAVATQVAAIKSGNVLSFTAKSESWVNVTDAKGHAVLNKTLKAGEVAGVSGELPMTATVGRADATKVEFRGKPFGLGDYTKNNVARFEVK